MSSREFEPSVLWREGMLFRPQHLQAAQRHLDDRFEALLRASHPHPYGLIDFESDEAALSSGQFVVRRLSVVLPSGRWIEVPGACADLQPLAVDSLLREAGEVRLRFGIPLEGDACRLATDADPRRPFRARLAADDHRVDENTGQDPQPVERRVWQGRVLLEGQHQGYESVPLARLVADTSAGGRPRLDPDFAPPALQLRAAPVLRRPFDAVLRDLENARQRMSEDASDHPPAGDTLPGLEALFKCQSLDRAHARIATLADCIDRLHPFELYRGLAELSADLAVFDAQSGVDAPPAYDHERPLAVLDLLADKARKRIARLHAIAKGETAAFHAVEDEGRLDAKLEREWLDEGWKLYVRVARAEDRDFEATHDRLTADFKLAPTSRVRQVAQQGAARGLELSGQQAGAARLPDRSDWFYFPLVRNSRGALLWSALGRDLALSGVWVRHAPDDWQMEIFAERIHDG